MGGRCKLLGGRVPCRWDDDVVFKNQARGEPKAQKRFINDTIRSDFHKKVSGWGGGRGGRAHTHFINGPIRSDYYV